MVKILINNEEVVCSNTFTIEESMLKTSSTILNNVYPKSWEDDKDYTSRFYCPPDYSNVIIYDEEDEEAEHPIFYGVVKNTSNISLNPRKPHFCSLQVLDYKTFLSECDILDYVINNKTIEEAIEELIDKISNYNFKKGTISITDNNIIGAYSTLDKAPYDVFQYLAEISNSKWFTRLVKENNKYFVYIDYYSYDTLPQGNDLEYSEASFEANSIVDISFNFNTRDYRNKQVIISNEIYGQVPYVDTIISDGYNKQYIVVNNIGELLSVYVNNVQKSFATTSEKEIGIEADFYYTPGSNQLESAISYSSGSDIVIRYTPLVQGRQQLINKDEVNRISNRSLINGTIARYERRDDVLDINELTNIAQTYLTYKGNLDITLNIETFNNDIMDIGTIIHFDMPDLIELTRDYLVINKKIRIIQNADERNIFYTYQLSSSYNNELAINYFDNQRRKANGNINTGEFITRNVDIDGGTYILNMDNFQVDEVVITGDNILECELEAPLNN